MNQQSFGGLKLGITHTPIACAPLDRCHLAGACNSHDGQCSSPQVDDGNPCTVDSCDPSTGAFRHAPLNVDDGNACTVDTCDPLTGPSHTQIACTPIDLCHLSGTCDPASGLCSNPPVNLDDGNPCTVDTCDPQTGIVAHTPNPSCGVTVAVVARDLAGKPVVGATVAFAGATRLTDLAGSARFDVPLPGRVIGTVSARNLASSSVVADLPAGVTSQNNVPLADANVVAILDGTDGVAAALAGIAVTIPPHGVVDGDGKAVGGTVELRIAPIDPTTMEQAFALDPKQGTALGGGPAELDRAMLAEVTLWQGATPLAIAPGAVATLVFTLPPSLQSAPEIQIGDTIGAWSYHPEKGAWIEESSGTVIAGAPQNNGPPQKLWQATVSHLGWWNATRPWLERNCLQVQVSAGIGGAPVAGAVVSAVGFGYHGGSSAITGQDGAACLDVRRGSTVAVSATDPAFPDSADGRAIIHVQGAVSTCESGGCTPVAIALTGTTCLNGVEVDKTGSGVGGIPVYAVHSIHDYLDSTTAITALDGSYCATVPEGGVAVDLIPRHADPSGNHSSASLRLTTLHSAAACGGACQPAPPLVLESARHATCVTGRLLVDDGLGNLAPPSARTAVEMMLFASAPPAMQCGNLMAPLVEITAESNGYFCLDFPLAARPGDAPPHSERFLLADGCPLGARPGDRCNPPRPVGDSLTSPVRACVHGDGIDVGDYILAPVCK